MLDSLVEGVLQGNQRATARLISQVENDGAAAQAAIAALYPATGHAHVIGVTGPPGSGKSTLVNAIATAYAASGRKVGVIAVDPSSPFTGGALLGDRVRMTDLATNNDIFVRSMASRGTLGGLARTTAVVIKILDAAGYDPVIVETVGAGQAEVDIAAAAHSVLVIEAPGMGDEVQSIKAGILEIADILVVNKADRPGAQRTVSALEMMLHMGSSGPVRHHGRLDDAGEEEHVGDDSEWQIPVLQTVAVENRGIKEVMAGLDAHHTHLQTSGEWLNRERRRSGQEIEQLVHGRFAAMLAGAVSKTERDALATAVAERRLTAYEAALTLFEGTLAISGTE